MNAKHIAKARFPNPTLVLRATSNGKDLFYTGRTGDGWVSPDVEEAFTYQTLPGARRSAGVHNKQYEIHGLWFIAMKILPDGQLLPASFCLPHPDDEQENEADWYEELNRGYAQDRI